MPHANAAPQPLPQARLDAMALVLESDPDFVTLPRFDPMGPAEHARALVSDISSRLRRACAHLTDDEFEALVLDGADAAVVRAVRARLGRQRRAETLEMLLGTDLEVALAPLLSSTISTAIPARR